MTHCKSVKGCLLVIGQEQIEGTASALVQLRIVGAGDNVRQLLEVG